MDSIIFVAHSIESNKRKKLQYHATVPSSSSNFLLLSNELNHGGLMGPTSMKDLHPCKGCRLYSSASSRARHIPCSRQDSSRRHLKISRSTFLILISIYLPVSSGTPQLKQAPISRLSAWPRHQTDSHHASHRATLEAESPFHHVHSFHSHPANPMIRSPFTSTIQGDSGGFNQTNKI